jgi:general secretion pathway protein N
MIHLPRFVMPGLAATLTLLLGAEWLLSGSQVIPPSRTLAIPAAPADDAPDGTVGQWGDTILARPLFNPDRRPVSEAGADASTSLPRLSAIIITSGTRAAIFAVDGQKPQVLTAGGTIDGYQLTHIAPGSVELAGPDGTVTLRPQFISASPPVSATPPGVIPADNSSNNNEENPN